jgi:transglutaminase-like putative cysteine protease
MRFESLYRISLYLLLFLAALILNIDSDAALLLGGSNFRYARFFPAAMAAAGVLAYLGVDRRPGRGLGPGAANLLGVASLMLVYLEYRIDRNQLVLACGHWLYYLTLVKMFRPKEPTDDWYLILLGLMQVLVGCFLSQGDRVGLLLVAWAILALWVLSLFYLHREAIRSGVAGPGPGALPAGVGGERAPEPYPGLFGLPFYIATARAAGMTLLLGVFIFLIMPRSDARTQPPRGAVSPRSLTGFSEEVRLGQMGEILENNAVVFTAELLVDGDRIEPQDELLWRGVTLTRYRDGRWRRDRSDIQSASPPAFRKGDGPLIEQRIRMEETSERVLFALRPIIEIEGPTDLIEMNATDGTLVREADRRSRRIFGGRRNNGPLSYSVFSESDPRGGIPIQPGENDIVASSYDGNGLLDLPDELVAPLGEIADRVVAGIPADDLVARARALEAYLRDSGEFHYSLQMTRADAALDPNLDFLTNTRTGHCEYFASALALLLRSQGIPSRVVNGFKGGDWNDLAQMLTVRQRHAHSWVEAYVGFTPDRARKPVWLPLDAAPAAEQAEQVAQVGGLPTSLRQVVDFVRYLWVFYVAGFNADRQEQLLYEPIRALVKEAREGFRIMREALLNALRWLTDFPSPTAIFSVKGFVVSCLVMLLTLVCYSVFRRLLGLLGRRLGGRFDAADAPSGALAAYVRLVRVLEQYGIQRPATETPREFARRASVLLGDRILDGEGRPLTDVPGRVVEAFYRVRYGALPLAAEVVAELDEQIDALEAGLRPAPG